MTEPTAEEAFEWLGKDREMSLKTRLGNWAVERNFYPGLLVLGSGSTPLEAIRNAMKGESDD